MLAMEEKTPDFSFVGFPCVLPRESESVLVGSAILGACASGDFSSIQVGTLNSDNYGLFFS